MILSMRNRARDKCLAGNYLARVPGGKLQANCAVYIMPVNSVVTILYVRYGNSLKAGELGRVCGVACRIGRRAA